MYLLDKIIFVKQISPPHWRDTWREAVLLVLLTPIFSIHKRLLKYRRETIDEINMSAQILILDAAVKRIGGHQASNVYDNNDGSFAVFIPKNTPKNVTVEMKKHISKYMPSGSRYDVKYLDALTTPTTNQNINNGDRK